MTDTSALPLADTSDMIGLHRVFREALDATPSYVGTVADGDADRAELVGSYYANVLALLHGHHEGEDLFLTPRLLERAPEHTEMIERIAGMHEDVLGGLESAETAVAQWRADASATNRDQAATALTALNEGLVPHLDLEEENVLPVAAQHINVAEWGELPSHGMRTFTGDKLWLILGLVQEQMTSEQKATMEANMPPPLLEFFNTTGRGLFSDYMGALRG